MSQPMALVVYCPVPCPVCGGRIDESHTFIQPVTGAFQRSTVSPCGHELTVEQADAVETAWRAAVRQAHEERGLSGY
jgi:hypothetical protein